MKKPNSERTRAICAAYLKGADIGDLAEAYGVRRLRQDLDSEVIDMNIWQKIKDLFRPGYIYRSSISGKIVSREFAEDNPKITYRQRVLYPRGGHHK